MVLPFSLPSNLLDGMVWVLTLHRIYGDQTYGTTCSMQYSFDINHLEYKNYIMARLMVLLSGFLNKSYCEKHFESGVNIVMLLQSYIVMIVRPRVHHICV